MKNQKGFSLIELLIVVIIIMIIAAIAIPSLLRARISANESATIGDTRTVISAQAAYASANAGLVEGNLQCLNTVTAGACIPNYPANGPTFLDSSIANLDFKSGYNRAFEPGTPPTKFPPNASPSSVDAFAYLSSPANIGRTGVRGFGGDSSGVLCSSQTGVQTPTDGKGSLVPTAGTCEIFQ
jgi:prepilin-type N-terminal cleavage/methylation domain-containing protein